MRERSLCPIHRSQQNGDDACLIGLMALQGALHLNTVTITGGKEVGTDKQKNHRGAVQMSVNGMSPIRAGDDQAIMPLSNQPLLAQKAEVLLQFLAELLIFMSIGVEKSDGRDH